MNIDLTNKVIVITGGAQGIGKATSIEFAKCGAIICVVDKNIQKGKETESILQSYNSLSAHFYADVSSEKDIEIVINKIESIFSVIDVLVNCAASGIIKGINASVEEWHEVFQTNVIGYVLCSKYCLKAMKRSEHGAIINIASISGFIAQPDYLTYNTSKAALLNMTRCLAMDLAKYNIRVNSVCPGTIWTENNAYFIGRDFGVDREGANKHPDIGGKHLLGRVGDPEEVAKTIVFLASEEASFITGENLVVDGGYTIKS